MDSLFDAKIIIISGEDVMPLSEFKVHAFTFRQLGRFITLPCTLMEISFSYS